MTGGSAGEPRIRANDLAPARLARLGGRLATWFESGARDLPWRRRRDGYTALVSEAMLQQTQVARVVERYGEFLRRFPDVASLAAADEQAVLAAWRGLGYYRRARNLHRAAKMIVDDLDGEMPETAEALRHLPGVGRYTAGAIASIVFSERAAIVDGNVQRVLARLFGIDSKPEDPRTVRMTWDAAQRLVDAASDPGAVNEGLMELGATVCTPTGPRCGECPLGRFCAAKRSGRQAEIPPSRARTRQKRVHHHAVLVRRNGHLLLERRPTSGLWSNMWQPPTVESSRKLGPRAVRNALDLACEGIRFRESFPHQTTHRRITFHVFEARSEADKGVWRRPEETDDLPMGNPHRRIISMTSDERVERSRCQKVKSSRGSRGNGGPK